MGFFDKALKKVQDVGENIAASANNVKTVVETSVQDTMEITGLKRQIRELEKEMDAQYLQIGKKYAEFVADMDDAEPETAENEAAEATESSEVIDEVKEEAIDEVKAEDVAETVDEAKEEAADETINEVKAEDTAETIDEEKEVSKDYIIKGFKHFTQLATEYFQGHSDCNAARKRMRDTIDANLQLKAELTAASYTEHTTLLSPKMQQIIWAHWGPPIISLSENHANESDNKRV